MKGAEVGRGEKGIYKGLSEAAIKGIKWAYVQGFYRLGKLGLTGAANRARKGRHKEGEREAAKGG